VFVSPRTKKPINRINNKPFRKARKEAGLDNCRVHDLKHTFGERLEAAGVPHELKQVLLGHKNENITTHYSRARIDQLLEAAERVVSVTDSGAAVIRVIGGIASPPKVPQGEKKTLLKVA